MGVKITRQVEVRAFVYDRDLRRELLRFGAAMVEFLVNASYIEVVEWEYAQEHPEVRSQQQMESYQALFRVQFNDGHEVEQLVDIELIGSRDGARAVAQRIFGRHNHLKRQRDGPA